MISAIKALLQFTTVLPLGKTAPFDAFAKATWLYPLAGYLTGGIAALTLLLLPAPPMVQAVLAIGVILLISGGNHLDGLLDLGDGLMAHGSREKRVRALTDRQMGTGALALGMIITLLSIVSLGSISPPIACIFTLILAEAGAKWAMAFLTVTGRPFHEGLHASLHERVKPWFLIPATLLMIPAFLTPLPPLFLICGAITIAAVPLCTRSLAYHLFGGVNGDVTGATGEITRAAVLLVAACLII